MNNKKSNSKLFAAVAVLALVACAFAIAMPADETDAATMSIGTIPAEGTTGVTYIDSETTDALAAFEAALSDSSVTTIVIAGVDLTINKNIVVPEGKTVYYAGAVPANATAAVVDEKNSDNLVLTVASTATLTVEGSFYNVVGKASNNSPLYIQGTVVMGQTGVMASTCAISIVNSTTAKFTGFFTSSADDTQSGVYRHIYSGDINTIAGYVNDMTYSDTQSETVKAVYTYGDVSIDSIAATTDLSAVKINVGGVTTVAASGSTPAVGASTLTIAEGVDLTVSTINVKNVSKAVNNGSITTTVADTVAGEFVNNGSYTYKADPEVTGTFTNTETASTSGFLSNEKVVYVDGSVVTYNNRVYNVYNKSISVTSTNGAAAEYYYLLGVNLGSPVYTGESFSLRQLEPRAVVVGKLYTSYDAETGLYSSPNATVTLQPIVNTDDSEANADLDNMIDAGTYSLNVTVNVNATTGSGAATYYVAADFTIRPADYGVEVVIGDGWAEGAYVDGTTEIPTYTITDINGQVVDLECKLTYIDSTNAEKTYTDPAKLVQGTYYVKVTGESQDPNYNDVDYTTTDVLTITGPASQYSDLIFHSMEELDAKTLESVIGDIDLADIQKGIKFTENGTYAGVKNVMVTGQVFYLGTDNATYVAAKALFTKLDSITAGGYFLAFYIEGVNYDLSTFTTTDAAVALGITEAVNDGTIMIEDITKDDLPTEPAAETVYNETEYRFYIMYTSKISADNRNNSEPVVDTYYFDVASDFDKISEQENGSVYLTTNYRVDFGYLNYYMIVLNDDSLENADPGVKNHTLIYFRLDGSYFNIPSGAADGFLHWTTEADCEQKDRTFATDSVMKVGDCYDGNDDLRIDLVSVYGAATGGDNNPGENPGENPGTPEVATDVEIGINVTETGVVVFINGVDGAVPTGEIVINYTYVDANGFQQSGSKPVTYTTENGEFDVVTVDLSEITGILLVNAAFAVDGQNLDSTAFMLF